LFLKQPAAEQRRLLQVIIEKAAWQNGTLRTTLFEPFEILRHSNREGCRKKTRTPGQGVIWKFGSPETLFSNYLSIYVFRRLGRDAFAEPQFS